MLFKLLHLSVHAVSKTISQFFQLKGKATFHKCHIGWANVTRALGYQMLNFLIFIFPFIGPHFAAVNQNNEIIVTDFHNHSVKVKTYSNILPSFSKVMSCLNYVSHF